MSKAIVRNV